MKKQNKVVYDLVLLFAVSGLLILPHVIGQGMIIGSDSIFHFNRFYDTAMQMKHRNFQYFISMYGFQASGRIVNALYGPLTAYFHGLLVLGSGSWFNYQVLANFVLYFLSACSMYFLLVKVGIMSSTRLFISILYVTTFSIQYWTMKQGFSSWGASLLPLCLCPTVDWVNKKEFRPLQLGVLTALMIQTHMLSSFILVIIYIPYFLFALFKTPNRLKLLRGFSLSIGLFILLTLNVWGGFFEVYHNNTILAPFINWSMSSDTLNAHSFFWLFRPAVLSLLLVIEVGTGFKWWRRYSSLHRLTWGMMVFFLILSTSLIPWTTLVNQGFSLVKLIQFPIRFFVPCTVLLLFSFCMTLQEVFPKFNRRWSHILLVSVMASLLQVLVSVSLAMDQWHHSNSFIHPGFYTGIHTKDMEKLKASFFNSDFSQSLQLIQKATPDYLPIYSTEGHQLAENKYEAYTQQIIEQEQYFSKRVSDHTLLVEWSAPTFGPIEVPIVKYHRTHLMLNGQVLTNQKIKLSDIGAPQFLEKKGENRLEVSYEPMPGFTTLLFLTFTAWLASIGVGARKLFLSIGKRSQIPKK